MNKKIFDLILIGLYAGLIVVSITYIRIPMPVNFVHPGNALVALSPLLLKRNNALVASVLGVFLFDLLNGYLSGSIFIVIEAIIIVFTTEFLFNKIFNKNDSIKNITIIGILDSIVKFILVFIKYLIRQMIIGNGFSASLIYAYSKMPASFFTAIVTMILFPLLYVSLNRVFKKYE